MNKNKFIGIKVLTLLLIIIVFVIVNIKINKRNYIKNNTYETKSEYLKTIDCAEMFDLYPQSRFAINFDACSSVEGDVLVYLQNGSSARYEFYEYVHLSPEMQHYEIEVLPRLVDDDIKEAYLSFYGTYGSGIIPKVQFISVTPCT